MPIKTPTKKRPFDQLVAVMAALRAKKGGCPWDLKQTHQSLKPYLIEESYELFEAIDAGDDQKILGELGDVLLQVVFHAQVAADRKAFDADDVAAAIAKKMIDRHPHVFGNSGKVKNAEEQLLKWEALKMKEKEHQARKSIVDGVPAAMPALMRAKRVLSKAARANFTWNRKSQAWAKFEEELKEFKSAARGKDNAHKEEELGDLLMAITNVARMEGLDAEHCLHEGVKKLTGRIQGVEERAAKDGRPMTELKEKDLLGYWQQVKKGEKKEARKPRSASLT
jgi:tetrapyrrole methylase family protein/MazG family protein